MGYKLENREIDLLGKRVSKIGNGKYGDVYKYRNQAIKVYPNNISSEEVLDEETARYFTGISTDKILLPRKLLYYNKDFSGYSLKLVDRKGAKKKIINAPSEDFIYNVRSLEDETELLSSKGILLGGVVPSNVLYNGDIYLTDPSKHVLFGTDDVSSLEKLNNYQLHLLLSELIIGDMRKENFRSDAISKVREIFLQKDDGEKSGDFFKNLLVGERDVKQFIKKM